MELKTDKKHATTYLLEEACGQAKPLPFLPLATPRGPELRSTQEDHHTVPRSSTQHNRVENCCV